MGNGGIRAEYADGRRRTLEEDERDAVRHALPPKLVYGHPELGASSSKYRYGGQSHAQEQQQHQQQHREREEEEQRGGSEIGHPPGAQSRQSESPLENEPAGGRETHSPSTPSTAASSRAESPTSRTRHDFKKQRAIHREHRPSRPRQTTVNTAQRPSGKRRFFKRTKSMPLLTGFRRPGSRKGPRIGQRGKRKKDTGADEETAAEELARSQSQADYESKGGLREGLESLLQEDSKVVEADEEDKLSTHSGVRDPSVVVDPVQCAITAQERALLDENCVVSRVLVINTGGTIGMKRTPEGFAPYPRFLEEYVRCTPLLNDRQYARLFPEYSKGCVTPPTNLRAHESFSRRVYYEFLECDPLLDSSNMGMADWVQIASMIEDNYDDYQGFVVLHGTDTMSYTASALSFMLENLGKSVVVTGAQRPMSENLSDGYSNFMGALTVAGYFNVPEVTILFSSKLYRGNRTTKMTAFSLDAFDSPNYPPLMELGAGIHLRQDLVFPSRTLARFKVHKDLNANVSIMRLFPGITVDTVRSFLKEPTKGVVIQSYGSGNGPDTRTDIWEAFKDAIARGVILVNCTQCSHGTVTDSYKAGRVLSNAGIIPGADMTPECALTKLCYILSMSEATYAEKCAIMRQNLRGELTIHREDLEEPQLDPSLAALPSKIHPALMCSAAAEGNVEQLQSLLEKGLTLLTSDYDMRTPLHLASAEGHLETVRFLLRHGASVHAVDRFDRTPLMDAILNTQLDVIELLVSTGATLQLSDVEVGSVLCRLTSQEKLPEITAWIAARADCNCKDYNGHTALHVAAREGFARIAEVLVTNGGADPNIPDDEGRTPLSLAIAYDRYDVTDFLMRHDQGSRSQSIVV